MQRLSIGSPGAIRPRLDGPAAAAAEEADEKAGKSGRTAPDKSIHLIPVLTLLCFLVLFLLSHDPAASSSSLTDSPPFLAVAARSLEATADTTASVGRGGVYRRLKEDPRLGRGRRKAGEGAAMMGGERGRG